VLPGHGQPSRKEIDGQDRDDLSVAQGFVAEAATGEQLKAARIERLPTDRATIMLDVQNMYLFPTAH
jgi:hypothetical protein